MQGCCQPTAAPSLQGNVIPSCKMWGAWANPGPQPAAHAGQRPTTTTCPHVNMGSTQRLRISLLLIRVLCVRAPWRLLRACHMLLGQAGVKRPPPTLQQCLGQSLLQQCRAHTTWWLVAAHAGQVSQQQPLGHACCPASHSSTQPCSAACPLPCRLSIGGCCTLKEHIHGIIASTLRPPAPPHSPANAPQECRKPQRMSLSPHTALQHSVPTLPACRPNSLWRPAGTAPRLPAGTRRVPPSLLVLLSRRPSTHVPCHCCWEPLRPALHPSSCIVLCHALLFPP